MTTSPPDLRRAWTRWFGVVEKLGERQLVRKYLTPVQYQILHKDVILACRFYETHPDSKIANTAKEMAKFAGPWISLDTLCDTEHKLIRELVREGDAKFGHRRRLLRLNFPGLLKLLKFLIGFGVVTLAVLYWQKPDLFAGLFDWSRDRWQSVLRFSHTNRKTFYALAVLFGAAMAYYLNISRSY